MCLFDVSGLHVSSVHAISIRPHTLEWVCVQSGAISEQLFMKTNARKDTCVQFGLTSGHFLEGGKDSSVKTIAFILEQYPDFDCEGHGRVLA